MSKLAEYERELERARTRHAEVGNQIKQLSQEDGELAAVVRGWEAIVARERKENGQPPVQPQNGDEHREAVELPDLTSKIDGFNDEEESGENKTQFVRDQIKANAAFGMTPNDLKKAAKAAGMEHPPSWPYGPIQRLKKKGEIIKRRGKFYPRILNAAE